MSKTEDYKKYTEKIRNNPDSPPPSVECTNKNVCPCMECFHRSYSIVPPVTSFTVNKSKTIIANLQVEETKYFKV